MVSLLDPQQPLDPLNEAVTFLRDGTLGVFVPAIAGGYIMGVGINMFGALVSVETTTQSMGAMDYFRHTMSNAHKLGRNFAYFGAVFGVMDLVFEKRRGKKDMMNPVLSGAFIGGFYGWRSYRRPGLIGGLVGGGAFSVIIEVIMDKVGMGQH
jgi:import inner membrane translocase subunit TIM17